MDTGLSRRVVQWAILSSLTGTVVVVVSYISRLPVGSRVGGWAYTIIGQFHLKLLLPFLIAGLLTSMMLWLSVQVSEHYPFPGSSIPFFALVPADLATIYRFNPLFSAGITGKGQTIALIEDSDLYNPDDWNTFRKTFGLDAYKGSSLKTVPRGGCSDPGLSPVGDDFEAVIDVEWASAAAPSADLQLASCANTTTVFGGLIAIQNLLNQRQVPPLISMSYAECEVDLGAAANAAYKETYLQAVLEGVSIFVAAGDNGAALCNISDPTLPPQS